MAVPFVSAADLEDYRKTAVDPDLAAIALDSACQLVRDQLGQVVDAVVDETVFLDSPGTDTLLLPQLPVTAVASLKLAGVVLVAGTDYLVDKELGVLRTKQLGYRFLPGRQIYEVKYSHGWTTVPASVRIIALTVAARIYDQGIVRQESVGGYQAVYSVAESATLTDKEINVLAKHDPGRKR